MIRCFLVLFISCAGFTVASKLGSFQQECGLNEVPVGCINPCPPQKNCLDRETYACIAAEVPCVYQCHCKEGYIRKTKDGECVPFEECGAHCTIDEDYTDCKPACLNETCSSLKNPSKCVSEESKPCKPGCLCKDGNFRHDKDFTCIPEYLCHLEDTTA